MLLKRLVTVAACLVAVVSGKEHIQAKIRNGDVVSRAANLGGWLLSEYWMSYTSPLYKNVPEKVGLSGEFGVMTLLGKEQGTKQFEQHWASWITEKDIAEIAKAGLNTVRVSTGYWIINDDDDSDKSTLARTYPMGGLKYLDTLINKWAVKYNVAVMVSLHAHKGSQNGMDHSAPAVMGKTGWSDSEDNVKSSLNYATFIAKRYKKSKAFLGLNFMNEPTNPTNYDTLKQYYTDAYKAIRADGNDCILVTSPWLQHQGPGAMDDFMPCPEFYNVWHEWHVYYKWGWGDASTDEIFAKAGSYGATHFEPWAGNPVFLGEWSLALTNETLLTDDEFKQFADIQMKEAEKAPAGWAFWAWHHDDDTLGRTSGWSMRQLIRKGLLTIPTTAGSRTGTKNAKCPVSSLSTSSADDDEETVVGGSMSGSGNHSMTLYTPDKVQAADTDANTTAPSATPKPTTSAAQPLQLGGAAIALLASTALAWVL